MPDHHENHEATSIEGELREHRPRPTAGARSGIRAMITAAGTLRGRPRHLRLLVAVYALAGLCLLALAALDVSGVGPIGG